MGEKIVISEKEIEEKVNFLSSAKCNHTQHMYIDITGDLVQGTLLSRIIYWFTVDKNKKSKVRIFKDGYFWIAKQRKDWWEEIRITERQYDKAIKDLEKKGFVELAKYKFNSMPTIHIRPNFDNINSVTEEWKNKLRKEIIAEYEDELQIEGNGNDTKCNSQGNDTKCKTGIPQDGNPLTLNTNNDYSNIDYRTNNTNISPTELNTSKDDPSASQLNTSLSEKEDVGEKTKKKKSEFKWVAVKNQIVSCMDKLGYGFMAEETEGAIETFRYYYMKYKDKTGENHPMLNEKTMISVLQRFLRGSHDVGGNFDEHAAIIEAHFDYDYVADVDWHIQHFMTEDIRNILYQRTK